MWYILRNTSSLYVEASMNSSQISLPFPGCPVIPIVLSPNTWFSSLLSSLGILFMLKNLCMLNLNVLMLRTWPYLHSVYFLIIKSNWNWIPQSKRWDFLSSSGSHEFSFLITEKLRQDYISIVSGGVFPLSPHPFFSFASKDEDLINSCEIESLSLHKWWNARLPQARGGRRTAVSGGWRLLFVSILEVANFFWIKSAISR